MLAYLSALFSVDTFLTVLEYVGALACAISGIRISSAKQFDLFGAYVVGLVTAIGGGTLRDIMLGVPMFWVSQPGYLINTFIALLVVWTFGRRIIKDNITWFIFDTIGLAMFSVIGVQKSLICGHSWWVAVVMGTITGAAGGVMRDVLVNTVPLIFRSELYATASACGGVASSLCLRLGCDPRLCAIIGGLTVVALRLAAIRFKIALPKMTGRAHLRLK